MELKEFAARWGDPHSMPVPVKATDLAQVERTFGVSLPSDYMEQVTSVGLPWPPHLLSAICECDADLNDLSQLCTPEEIVAETRGWHQIGLPDNLLVVGRDSMGSKFCFDMDELQGGRKSFAAVYFWDHDFNETTEVAESFAAWIAQYLGPWSDGFDASS